MISRDRLRALIKKEFIQFFRSRPMVILVVWTIAVEIAICAYAITYDVKHLSLGIGNLDGSPASRELISRLSETDYFDVAFVALSPSELDDQLAAGRIDLALVIPSWFAERLAQGVPVSVQVLVDGSNSNAALIALGYVERIIRAYSRQIELGRLERSVGSGLQVPSIRDESRVWYNPGLKSVYFIVVSMLVLGVMIIATIHPAAAIAWEKEAGTIDQILVMPFRAWELMVAKVLPTFVISLLSLAAALWVPWWFEVPIRGSLPLFFLLSALFLFSSSGWGLFLGSLAGNLQQALLLAFFTIFPIMVISGTLVPVEAMPKGIQILSYLSPLTYYMHIANGIFLKGVGLDVLWPQVVAMSGLGAGIFGVGLRRFERHLG